MWYNYPIDLILEYWFIGQFYKQYLSSFFIDFLFRSNTQQLTMLFVLPFQSWAIMDVVFLVAIKNIIICFPFLFVMKKGVWVYCSQGSYYLQQSILLSRILRDKTKGDKFIFISNDDTQNYPFWRFKSVVETFDHQSKKALI